MSGVLVSQPSTSTNDKHAWLLRLVLKTTAGGKYLAANEERYPNEEINDDSDDDNRYVSVTSSSRSLSGGLPVVVVSAVSDAHQIAQLRDAAVGTWILVVARGQTSPAFRNKSGGGGRATNTILTAYEKGGAQDETHFLSASTALGTGWMGVLWGSRWWQQRSSSRSTRLGLYCKFPGAIVECPLDGSAFRLVENTVVERDAQEYAQVILSPTHCTRQPIMLRLFRGFNLQRRLGYFVGCMDGLLLVDANVDRHLYSCTYGIAFGGYVALFLFYRSAFLQGIFSLYNFGRSRT